MKTLKVRKMKFWISFQHDVQLPTVSFIGLHLPAAGILSKKSAGWTFQFGCPYLIHGSVTSGVVPFNRCLVSPSLTVSLEKTSLRWFYVLFS